jgi:hypothetical protein
MEISINTFHILHQHLLIQNHLVKRNNKEGIKETTMKDGKTHNTTDKSKVIQMLGIDTGMWIDL